MTETIERNCAKPGDCRDEDYNCSIMGSDGLPVQCVGEWAEDKYYYLTRYLEISCQARKKFTDQGNSVFIDLFSGPGRCYARELQREIASGGYRVAEEMKVPFNKTYFVDICEQNIDALRMRITNARNVEYCRGNCNELVESIVAVLAKKDYCYHFAYVDPFGPSALKFETLRKLARFTRMDMLIHFPIGSIRRTIEKWSEKNNGVILDEFLGTVAWRERYEKAHNPNVVYDVFKEQLASLGYAGKLYETQDIPVKNSKKVELYKLLLAAKHKTARKMWNETLKIDARGQRLLL